MFQEGRESSYLAASFCSSARLFCSSWARWSSRSRALRASTSAARFASASRLGSTSYRPRLLTMLRLWFTNAIFYRVNFCTSFVTNKVTKFMVYVVQSDSMHCLIFLRIYNEWYNSWAMGMQHLCWCFIIAVWYTLQWYFSLTSVFHGPQLPLFLFSPSLPFPVAAAPGDWL